MDTLGALGGPQTRSYLDRLDDGLVHVAVQGNTEEVQTLIAAGANVHAWSDYPLFQAACPCYDDDALRYTETVLALLAAGADVHARDGDALRYAARYGHAETVNVLEAHIAAETKAEGKVERPAPKASAPGAPGPA